MRENTFDPKLLNLIESAFIPMEFIYCEQIDGPPYDYLVIGVCKDALMISEQVDFHERLRPCILDKNIYERFPNPTTLIGIKSRREKQVKICGGVLLGIWMPGDKLQFIAKFEELDTESKIILVEFLISLRAWVSFLGISFRREWLVAPLIGAPKICTESDNSKVVDLNLPMRLRLKIKKFGINVVYDFSRLRETEFMACLYGSDAEKQDLLNLVRTEIGKFGVTMLP